MRKMRATLLSLLALIIIGLAVTPAFAQDTGGITVVFHDVAKKVALETILPDAPVFFTYSGSASVNLRADKNAGDADNVLASMEPGAVVQQFKVEQGADGNAWHLVRAWDATKYEGTGWVRDDVFKTSAAPAQLPSLVTPDCQRVDEGVQLSARVKIADGWLFDALSNGCNLLVEGRQVATRHHNIWLLREGTTQNMVDTRNYLFWFLEGSVWEYPLDWNMGNFAATKPPIAAEFVNAKRKNMQENVSTPYDWPISVWLPDGKEMVYDVGETVPGVTLFSGCDFTEPEFIEISGIYTPADPIAYNASIGANACRTLAWGHTTEIVDQTDVYLWTNAQDNFKFNTLTAYLMPKNWTDDQVRAFFLEQKITGSMVIHEDAALVLGKTSG